MVYLKKSSPELSISFAFTTLKQCLAWSPPLFFILVFCSCDITSPEETEEEGRGSIIETSLLERISIEQIKSHGLAVPVVYDVDLHRIVYRTVDPEGGETVASGVIAIPQDILISMPLLSYQHGTEVLKAGVASVIGSDALETLIAVIFASNGYLTVMPDYLGLGSSPGLHPYMHAASLASATVDMLRSGRLFAESESIYLNDRLFLTGYSEGGFATAATQRLIEEVFTAEFSLTASAPMAGSYDMSGTMLDLLLNEKEYEGAYYLPYLLLAYNPIYELFGTPVDVFVSPYADQVPLLFDGSHSAGTINRELPSIPIDIIQPEYVDAVAQNENHPLRVALRDNDLYNWTPQAPTRLYHCLEDEIVPYENATVASQRFWERGATQVTLVSLDAGGHGACIIPALFQAKVWFDSFRDADLALGIVR